LITLPELLKDPKYREFFTTVPKTLVPKPGQKPWRLYIQKEADGPWYKKDFEKYADAFRLLARGLKGNNPPHDATIQSRGIAYAPPTRIAKVTKNGRPVYQVGSDGKRRQKTVTVQWRPRLDGMDEAHTWCPYCRRPTTFKWFRSHHALRASGMDGLVDPSDKRCVICGVRESFALAVLPTARLPHFDPRDAVRQGRKARR
jgi:hypothetical protein